MIVEVNEMKNGLMKWTFIMTKKEMAEYELRKINGSPIERIDFSNAGESYSNSRMNEEDLHDREQQIKEITQVAMNQI